jgi:Putative zinc-finger
MSTRDGCQTVRELAPELALGIADGKERAEALAHLASCAACRSYLAGLTDVADDLLALLPSEEPPVGFETSVLTELGIEPSRPSRRPRLRFAFQPRRILLATASACLLAVAATASVLLLTFQDERELAGQYRTALDNVGGEYFQATRLYNDRRTPVGQVFGYQGRPSWLFVVVYAPYRETALTGTLTTTTGETVPLRAIDLDAQRASWGGEIPIDLREVESLRLVDRRGNVYRAQIPGGPGG